jgi:hypothetical protein
MPALGTAPAAHHHSGSKTRVNALVAKSGALHCVRGKPVIINQVAAGFFFAFGFAVFDSAGGSGPRSTDVRRPDVNV